MCSPRPRDPGSPGAPGVVEARPHLGLHHRFCLQRRGRGHRGHVLAVKPGDRHRDTRERRIQRTVMTRFGMLPTVLLALLASALPALAAAPIQDGVGMFSASTVSTLNQEISSFTAQTGKQIVVVTVPSLSGKPLKDAAEA